MAVIDPWREKIDSNPATEIDSLYKAVKRWRTDHETRWEEFYKLYRSYIDEDEHPWRANLFIPYTFSVIETVVPKMLGSIFNTKPIISIVTRKGNEIRPEEMEEMSELLDSMGLDTSSMMPTSDLAELIERLLDYQFEDESLEFYFMLEEFFKDAAIYGTAFAKIVPKFADEEELVLDSIDFLPIDLWNIFPDWRATSIKDSKFIIERREIDIEELLDKQDQGIYEHVDELVDYAESKFKIDEYRKLRLDSIEVSEDMYGDWSEARKSVQVLEYWDRQKIYHVAAGKFILLEDDNPFGDVLPYVMMKYTPVPHELYAIGIPEMTESLQHELNSIRNQRMDNINLINNRMFVVNKLADIDIDNLISYPGNVITTNDIESIKPLDTADITRSIYMEEDIIKRDIQNATGEYEYSRGATPQHRETATGIIKLQQAASVRFDAVLKNVEFTFREIAKLFIWYNSQFLEPQDFAKIVGTKDFVRMGGPYFYELPVEEMLKLYHFQPVGSSTTAVKELRIQQIMQLYQVANQDPFFNQYELRKKLLNALDMLDYDKLLKTEEQVRNEQKEMMMAEAQAQVAARGEAGPGATEGGGMVGGEQPTERMTASMVGVEEQAPGRAVTAGAGTEGAMI